MKENKYQPVDDSCLGHPVAKLECFSGREIIEFAGILLTTELKEPYSNTVKYRSYVTLKIHYDDENCGIFSPFVWDKERLIKIPGYDYEKETPDIPIKKLQETFKKYEDFMINNEVKRCH